MLLVLLYYINIPHIDCGEENCILILDTFRSSLSLYAM